MSRAAASTSRAAGFTLIEALIATMILAVATVGIAQLLAASSQQAAAMNRKATSLELAKQLMEEIAAHPVADALGAISLGHEIGETSRSQYDTIDDYHQYTDSTDNLTMFDGTPVDLGDGPTYTRTVWVEYRNTPSGSSTSSSSAPFCAVTVTVTPTNGIPTTLTRLFARTTGGY
jgi:type II secretory pathway pseudopilin PulG